MTSDIFSLGFIFACIWVGFFVAIGFGIAYAIGHVLLALFIKMFD